MNINYLTCFWVLKMLIVFFLFTLFINVLNLKKRLETLNFVLAALTPAGSKFD